MNQKRTISIKLKGNDYNIHFRYCSPGRFRISNVPKLAAKNAIIEFSKGFWIQENTVSLGLYEVAFNKPYYEYDLKKMEKMNFPWNRMDFQEIQVFLEKINILLSACGQDINVDIPTRFEWEHALLAGDDADWSWGNNEEELDDYAWYVINSGDKIHPSKQKKCNKWGLFDLYGNVHEYCYDSEFDVGKSIIVDPKPQLPSKEDVLPCMGGAYDSEREGCRKYRYIGYYNEYIQPTGFRLIIREWAVSNLSPA